MKPKHIIIFSLVFLSMVILHLVLRTINMNLSYKTEKLKIEFNELYSQNKKLSAKVAQKSSLERLEQLAKYKLGMERPEKVYYIVGSGEAK